MGEKVIRVLGFEDQSVIDIHELSGNQANLLTKDKRVNANGKYVLQIIEELNARGLRVEVSVSEGEDSRTFLDKLAGM